MNLTIKWLLAGTTDCGVSDVVDSRIVNGVEAVKHSIPWQAYLEFTNNGYVEKICGGTIIDSTHILTAAHCTEGYSPSQIEVC